MKELMPIYARSNSADELFYVHYTEIALSHQRQQTNKKFGYFEKKAQKRKRSRL